MYNRTAKPKPEVAQSAPDPLERGQFDDGQRCFIVCASSAEAPDSFQVYAKGNRADVILIVSGLNTGNEHATWNDEWRSSSPEWREWAWNCAFRVFHNPNARQATTPRSGEIRFCRG